MKQRGTFHRLGYFLLCLLAVAGFIFPARGEAREKVLLDADMVELFDDGVAMLMLAQSSRAELIGVTVTTGNVWVEDCVAYTIRQLEGMGLTDVPVAAGLPDRAMRERLANMEKEKQLFGRGHDGHMGAAGYPEPSDWRSAYRAHYQAEPSFGPVEERPEDLIIRLVKENPNQVTLLAIGPCTNLAAAIAKAPEIVPLTKRIVYMSGAFFQQGNVTPAAEFNVWIDPSAAKAVMRAPWKEQIIVPLDACEKMSLTAEEFAGLSRRIRNPLYRQMMERHYLVERFASGEGPTFIWDVLAAALIIDPTVITEERTLPVDVNDVWSPSYGQTLAYLGNAPEGTQRARIVLTVSQEKIARMVQRVFDNM
ncbi:MAG: nucleoside hydrolase [Schwartzia sp.]|nr:nucleoside hydrolase [Schwartzia sp. (in: firmicutes)]